MLGHGHGRIGRLPAQQRRRIGRGDHHDRARQALRAELILQKLPNFPPALADQRQHDDVGFALPRHHREQGGFADARAREQAKPLPLAAGHEAIERADTQIEPRAQPGAQRRVRHRPARHAPDRPVR